MLTPEILRAAAKIIVTPGETTFACIAVGVAVAHQEGRRYSGADARMLEPYLQAAGLPVGGEWLADEERADYIADEAERRHVKALWLEALANKIEQEA